MLCLYVQAPFAACRSFTAGWYRPTATFLTPSAAYGLVLNVAGIESRLREEEEGHDGGTAASLMRPGLPPLRLALGVPASPSGAPFPLVQTIYQQLHNYPVGTSGSERAESAHGSKYNITPVRREFLTGLQAVIALDDKPDLEDRIRRGLRGELNSRRYGLPFLGDDAYLVDRLEICSSIPSAYWYERITEATGTGPRPRTTRLTILIDRADLSRTTSALYAPTEEPSTTIPPTAWTLLEPPAPEPAPPPRRGRGKQ
jgi:CRISPR-associated protein Cas5t